MENIETIEQLRQERSLLATAHKELQRRFSENSDVSLLVLSGNRDTKAKVASVYSK
jgi:hypothetical protein